MSLYSDVNYRLGNYKASSLILRNIIDKDETNYTAWEQLLFCESALENKDSVIYFGMKAINVFANRPLPYLIMASVYYSDEKYEEALALLKIGEAYLESGTLQVEYFSLLAECYGKTGNAAIADRYYEDALLLDSMNFGILNNYAYSLAVRNEDLGKAERMSKITIDAEPGSSTFLDTYAWIMYKSNRINEALKYIKRAVKFGGDKNAEILEHYGDILAKKGRRNKAFQIWTEALDLGDEIFKERIRIKMKDIGSSI
jgi:Tfp pilus assembly protein PilF